MSRRAAGLAAAVIALAAICVVVLSGAALAAEPAPCGGVSLRDGRVVSGVPLTVERARELTLNGCMASIASTLLAEPGITSVTVAARAEDKARADGSALAAAQQVANALVLSGLPEHRVSAVAPLLRAGEAPGLYVTYAVRRRGRTVGTLVSSRGQVSAGAPGAERAAVAPGARLAEGDWVETGADAVAVIALEDGSRIRLGAGGELRLKSVLLSHQGLRRVRLVLTRGRIESIVRPAGARSQFEIMSGTAVAGVRGTTFRVAADPVEVTTRVETLEGLVGLEAASARVDLPGGSGSQVVGDQPPEPPRDLLQPPKVAAPLRGVVSSSKRLEWAPAAGAALYRVEVARDAAFVQEYSSVETRDTELGVGTVPAAGRWFWRVTAVDADGFSGFASKTYAFELAP
ncbi:MAG: FecR domain-containing protein [Deltaproteobacteria bacterium]|nr:FecR domain-containing protein [Deltaproteobacteria bacterium]MCB9787550.1 FecR domain-containing protein [Deltaproteobacteria bacterium]